MLFLALLLYHDLILSFVWNPEHIEVHYQLASSSWLIDVFDPVMDLSAVLDAEEHLYN